MSVSLTMVPVALALRVVMGKERFNEWIESNERPVVTNFKSKKELTTTLHSAGYDALPYGNLIKTHHYQKDFFFWELRDQQWVALFSKYDEGPKMNDFIHHLEETIGRKITGNLNEKPSTVSSQQRTFPTNFSDFELLKATLQDEQIPFQHKDQQSIESILSDARLIFQQKEVDGPITVSLESTTSLSNIYQHLSTLDESYREKIQQQTYQQVMTHAESQGFTIEDEMRLPDESILITLKVGD